MNYYRVRYVLKNDDSYNIVYMNAENETELYKKFDNDPDYKNPENPLRMRFAECYRKEGENFFRPIQTESLVLAEYPLGKWAVISRGRTLAECLKYREEMYAENPERPIIVITEDYHTTGLICSADRMEESTHFNAIYGSPDDYRNNKMVSQKQLDLYKGKFINHTSQGKKPEIGQYVIEESFTPIKEPQKQKISFKEFNALVFDNNLVYDYNKDTGEYTTKYKDIDYYAILERKENV